MGFQVPKGRLIIPNQWLESGSFSLSWRTKMLPTVIPLMTLFEFLHIVHAVDDIPIIGFNAKRNQKEFSSYMVLKAGPYKWIFVSIFFIMGMWNTKRFYFRSCGNCDGILECLL